MCREENGSRRFFFFDIAPVDLHQVENPLRRARRLRAHVYMCECTNEINALDDDTPSNHAAPPVLKKNSNGIPYVPS